MRFPPLIVALLGFAAPVALSAPAQAGAPPEIVASGEFDFYVLTLSWSPGFCDTGGAAKAPGQCAVGAGKGFVVHGLWPDNQNGPDPSDCDYGGDIPYATLARTRGVYPDPGLARYEYGKHGTCTGLSAENYFSAVKYARDQFVIPDMLRAPTAPLATSPSQIEDAFMAVNPHLSADNMAVTCARGELIDVRFCVSKDLGAFVDCPKVSRHTCQSASISVAPPR
jgi:ribonuclease T2